MKFKLSFGTTCLALLLVLFTKTAISATVFGTTFTDGFGSSGSVYLVKNGIVVSGLYIDYAVDGL